MLENKHAGFYTESRANQFEYIHLLHWVAASWVACTYSVWLMAMGITPDKAHIVCQQVGASQDLRYL